MNEFALHAPSGRTGWRWVGSAIVIVAVHAGLIAAGLSWYREPDAGGAELPAIMVDMSPASAAPEVSQQDAAPGPEMQQAEAPSEPPPEPVQPQQMEEQVAPTPPVEKPVVEAPPEQKIEPTPPPPEPAKVTPEPPKPVPEPPKLKPVRTEVKKKPSDTPPAPRTTAPPRAERQAAASAARAGAAAAAAALPSYRDRLNAHLQRYKQASNDGKQGVATLSFTVSRSGQVLGSRISGSSGVPELDAATLALIRRAQPLPPFPPEITQASMSFSVPIRYLNR
jgi:protein TonB